MSLSLSRCFPMNVLRTASIAAVLACVLAPSTAHADPSESQPTVAQPRKIENGGFGAPELKLTPLAGSLGVLMGSQGGWIIDHRFVLGGAGYGLVNDVTLDRGGAARTVSFGYGGLRPAVLLGAREDVVHFSAAAVVGAAGASVGDGASAVTWVIEPDVGVDASVTRWLRLGISGSYRFVGAAEDARLRSAQLSGPAVALMVKFGTF